MSTCRDCIHCDVCLENAKEELKLAGLNIDLENLPLSLNKCEFFKDKSKIVELPCKVGDMVYMVTPNAKIRNLTILGIDIEIEKTEQNITCLSVYEFEGNSCYMQIQYSKFGKTVFTSKEAAEKALQELNRQDE